jgi:N-acetylglutamate synthase-like GNAT family acetyltransferase
MNNEYLVTIRKARENDIPAIAGILRSQQTFAHINQEAPADTEQRMRRHFNLCAASPSHSIYVAEDTTGQVAGYAAVHWLPYLLLTGLRDMCPNYLSMLLPKAGGLAPCCWRK